MPHAEGGTAADGTLTLTGVGSDVLAFTVGPQGEARRIPTGDFTAAWDALGFDDAPPRAVLRALVGEERRTGALTLHDPDWDASSGTLRFRYDPIGHGRGDVLGSIGAHTGGAPPPSFGPATLVIRGAGIDEAPIPPGSTAGIATLSAISQEEYAQLLGQAQAPSTSPCVTPSASGAIPVCPLIVIQGDGVDWTVFAQAPAGTDVSTSAAKLTVEEVDDTIVASHPHRTHGIAMGAGGVAVTAHPSARGRPPVQGGRADRP